MSFESMTRSSTSPRDSNVPDCWSSLSTKVVLPWSTCAIIAMFLNFSICGVVIGVCFTFSLRLAA
ncbi:Uncharacterised protein [Vibrio cholerae]|nr:Uncharacterised protein [Vibrio cholerae]